jgi:hypothetical protein
MYAAFLCLCNLVTKDFLLQAFSSYPVFFSSDCHRLNRSKVDKKGLILMDIHFAWGIMLARNGGDLTSLA